MQGTDGRILDRQGPESFSSRMSLATMCLYMFVDAFFFWYLSWQMGVGDYIYFSVILS